MAKDERQELAELEELELLEQREAAAQKPMVSGALGSMDRLALGFASSQPEKESYLLKKYPEAKIAEVNKERVIQLPNETFFRRLDDPGLELADVADVVGDIPGIAGSIGGGLIGGITGSIPGAIGGSAVGAGAGEVARKAIGRGIIGIPSEAPLIEDVKDVGIAAGTDLAFGLIPGVGRAVKGMLPKKAVTEAVSGVAPTIVKEGAEIYRPTGISDLQKQVLEGEARGLAKTSPRANELDSALKSLPELQTKLPPIYREMAEDKTARARLGTLTREAYDESGLPTAQALGQLENQLKQETTNIIDDIVENKVGTGRPKFVSAKEAGDDAIENLKNIYQKEKVDLGPEFKAFQKTKFPVGQANTNLKSRVYESFPELDEYLTPGPKGELILAKWNAAMPITKQEYAAISEALEAVNAGKTSVKEIQSIRSNVRSNMDPSKPALTPNLSRFNSALLSHLQDTIEAQKPKFDVRGTFKQYAINEQKRENFERMLGVRLDNVKQEFQQAPERVLAKVFQNSNNANLTKEFIGPEMYGDIVGDWINVNKQKMTRDGVLSAANFENFLEKNKDLIVPGIGEESFNKLKAASTVQRFTSDLAPFNTSGTETARNIRLGDITRPKELLEKAGESIQKGFRQKQATKELEEALQKGLPSQAEKKPGLIKQVKEKAGGLVGKKTKALGKGFLGTQATKEERQNE